jgi:dihydroorotate dehydrogenase (NAD+) catalytic subunit
MVINVETKRPILSNKFGGLSGTPIKPIALRCVYEISSNYNVPIIGCGGISTWEDAVEFFLAGASSVQLGSIIGDNWIGVFNDINNGIKKYMNDNGLSKIEEMIGLAKKS